MIRNTLPNDLKEYYNDIDNVSWDTDKVVCLEKKKGFLGLYTRYLYLLPDAYEVLGKKQDIFIYHYTQKKKRPTIICAPILGGKMKKKDGKWKGSFPIATINAWIFSVFKRWNALVVCTDNKAMFTDGDTPENFELALKNVAYNNIQAIQFIKTLDETDHDKIYALGVSLGALTMCCMAGIEDTIKASVLILGGGPLSIVISQSTEGSVRKFFERFKKSHNLTDEQATLALNEHLKTNTTRLGKYIPDGTSMMILSECDTSVVTDSQKKLLEVVKPREYFLNKLPKYFQWLSIFSSKASNGHYLTAALYPFLIFKTMLFLHKVRREK